MQSTLVSSQSNGTQSEEQFNMAQMLPDILREIFWLCLPPFKYRESTFFELDQPPYTLAKVCRHWRSVCLSTPLLWVDMPTVFTDVESSSPDFYEHWRTKLALSYPCELRLYLIHYDHLTPTSNLQLIQDTFPRVRTLDLNANAQLLTAISHIANRFERLRFLKIDCNEFDSTSPFPQLEFPTTISSLKLTTRKRLDISRSLLKCVESIIPTLTRFEGDTLPVSSLRQILSVAPLLMQLSIRSAQEESASETPDSLPMEINHSHLRTLHLLCKIPKSYGSSASLPFDLTGIRLPVLEELTIQYSLSEASTTFISFLQHTQGRLTSLYIGGVMDPYHQKALYESCPRLEDLTMAYADDLSLAPLVQTRISRGGPYCPRLRHLTLPFLRLDLAVDYPLRTHLLDELSCGRFSKPEPLGSHLGYIPMASLTVTVARSSNFLQFQTLEELQAYSAGFTPTLSILPRLQECIQTTPHSFCLVEDLGLISWLKNVIDEGTELSALEQARVVYAQFTKLSDELRGKPRWKMEMDPNLKKKLEKWVFKHYPVAEP